MSVILHARNLCAYYGATQVLFGFDMAIEEGGITTMLGANGAGKTTPLRALSGMVRTGGEIVFAGRSIANMATEDIVRLGIAHVPQGRGTFSRQTVEENLQIGAMTRPAAPRSPPTSSASMRTSRASRSATRSRPARSRAANSRCSPSAAP